MGSNNFIEKYELIDGWAIVNNNFKVVSANGNYNGLGRVTIRIAGCLWR